MVKKLKGVSIHGNHKIFEILEDGIKIFHKTIDQYCNSNGSKNTILEWGNETTLSSIFIQGLNKKDRFCFLEVSFDRKDVKKNNIKQGRVDAHLIDRSMNNKTLTSVIEAKRMNPWISKSKPKAGISDIKKALKKAKDQLNDIDRDDICEEEELVSEDHIYRIAIIYTVLNVRFAESGEGKNMNWYNCEDIRSRAKEYFNNVENRIKKENILHYQYLHSINQLKLIKEYYGTTMENDEGNRPYNKTYHAVGVLTTIAIFK
ncbi:MAG: hypothetical protein K8R25_08045 [Methanosarcinales archaeon]|nr:hypothetical protein [Methanosarcinales archaeon]